MKTRRSRSGIVSRKRRTAASLGLPFLGGLCGSKKQAVSCRAACSHNPPQVSSPQNRHLVLLPAGCEKIFLKQPLGVSSIGEDSRECARLAAEAGDGCRRVLDVGTGTGYIAIYLAKLGKRVDAVDVNPKAVRVARENAARNGVRVRVFQSDLADAVDGEYDLIVSNLSICGAGETVKSLFRRIPGIDFFRPLFCRFSGTRLRLADRLLAKSAALLSEKGRMVVNLPAREAEGLFEKHGFTPMKEVVKKAYCFTVLEKRK